ncbi:MAG TPA: diguanylate cyclase [Thermoanaerobaculia bacterium]|nr:diguanylate cyclase [Thermoanaerobaculia bacterium]
MSRAARFVIALALILAVGWIDYVTGPEIGMSLLYLIPIALVAWTGGLEALVCAIVGAGCWFAADLPWHTPDYVKISAWNGFTRVVMFGSVAFLVHRVRIDRDALLYVNVQLADAVRREASLARTDQLTGLPNSRAFLEYLFRETARVAREHSTLCVLYIDLDRFKMVNDVYSHDCGDTVLRKTAEAIAHSIRDGDVVARLGGDEFAVLLWHVTEADAQHVVDRITERIDAIAAEFPEAQLGVSVGIGYFDEPPADPEDAVRAADRAMYRAKDARRQTDT